MKPPASESGRLRHGDGATRGATAAGGCSYGISVAFYPLIVAGSASRCSAVGTRILHEIDSDLREVGERNRDRSLSLACSRCGLLDVASRASQRQERGSISG